MAKAYLSQLLELGTTETGSRAVGGSFASNFFNGLQGVADAITERITDDILTPLVEKNFGMDVEAKLVVSNIMPEDQGQMLEHIATFLENGIIAPSDGQRQFILDLLGVPNE